MIKTILFDIGGVVTKINFGAVYENFGSRIGLSKEIVENYHKENFHDMLTGKTTLEDFWNDFKKLGGRDGISYEEVWLEELMNNRIVDLELLTTIKELRKKYTVGVLSNLTFSRLIADEKIDLYSNFDYTVLSCLENLRKPDPDFYRLALKRAQVNPEEAILIDDKENNLDVAEKIGMKTILYSFKNNEKLHADFVELGINFS